MGIQTEKKEAGSLVDSMAEILKKHCIDIYQIECLINSIISSNEYIQEMQAHRSDTIYGIRKIEDILRKNGDDKLCTLFREISDTFIEGMILSGHIRPGNELIYKMADDFDSLL